MKIEKVSDNQIRCTLSKDDLVDRQLRISELAYGTEKAKALFREMMQQASSEFGFEADDIPLMIEAIPISSDCLILVITKVEDPDELDTRFSKFSPDQVDEENETEVSSEAYADEIINCFDQLNDLLDEQNEGKNEEEDSISFSTVPTEEEEKEPVKKEVSIKTDLTKVFSFHSLNEISTLAIHLSSFYHGVNHVYKNPVNGLYYLSINKSEHSPEEFNKICNITSEYGKSERTTYATSEYFNEHFELIIKDKAIQVLATL
ncbi:adaptor protein MecA [Anaeromicropila populeti]|uniref:Adapter protein MecA 1/2 n=1 Tax=Anaeromicropila populeti TaxID=37658 RepID=A0A1I6I7R1_9FIRM|nr:adaptor protein MecA [Anaeromicropila populeti]SFR62694.1 adapter protein MecA 1/2 [Anaeromicropila populeti]